MSALEAKDKLYKYYYNTYPDSLLMSGPAHRDNIIKMKAFISVIFLAIAVYFFRDQSRSLPKVTENIDSEYDYVIVGAGAAGSVLAARLTEDNVTVLVLEAGGEEVYTPEMELAIYSPTLLQTKHSWQDYTVPQKNTCLGMIDRKCFLPRGRGLGGGSSHNAIQYVRGNAEDYDRWAEQGAKGWSYKDVLPYFIKSEGMTIPELKNSKYHGTDGPLNIIPGGFTKFSYAFVEAGKELGWQEVDINGQSQEGFTKGQLNALPDGTRASTVKVFLRPAMERENLHVAVDSFVTKVVLDGKKAVGLEYIRNGAVHVVKARKEVILSAGAIASPKILMLSGIGPKKHLEEMGIHVVADLPVGDNFQDHQMMDGVAAILDPGSSITFNDMMSSYEAAKRKLTGRSKLSAGFTLDGLAFVRAPSQPKDRKAPFLEFHPFNKLLGEPKETWGIVQKAFSWTDEFFQEQIALNGEMIGKDGTHIFPTLLHPYSKGTVRLTSGDPFAPPSIDPKYFTDKRDIQLMLEAIRIAQKISKTIAMNTLGIKVLERPFSACTKNDKYDSDGYWECMMRYNTLNVYHGSSTCKMGARDDPTAVVDPELRVRGIDNLRVIDLSITPEIPSGNTHAPSIMIGEKGADLIRGKVTVKPMTL